MSVPFLRSCAGIIAFCMISVLPLPAQVILTEIMFDADTLEFHNEFVEIFNLGEDIVDLTGWSIGDSLELDLIIATDAGLLLYPGQFAVILDGSYLQNSTTYDSLIPVEALRVQIDDGSFGRSGWSNSQGEPVILVNPPGDTMQIYKYLPGNEPGFSDEKIVQIPSNSVDNWSDSRILRGTPGFRNSVTPFDYDLEADSIWIVPEYPVEDQSFQIYAEVKNSGLQDIEYFEVLLFNDLNGNSNPDPDEILHQENIDQVLAYRDSIIFEHSVTGFQSGAYRIGVKVNLENDQDLQNNMTAVELRIEQMHSPVIINEIMFSPVAGRNEWIEIYNNGATPVDLKNWFFSDSRDTVSFPNNPIWLQGRDFLIISGDSSVIFDYNIPDMPIVIPSAFPTLNNDFDDLQLISVSGRTIDRVAYTGDWLGRNAGDGVSLERINPIVSSQLPENWSGSVDPTGSTPGRENSVFLAAPVSQADISISPNPFSPDEDGFEDVTILQYEFPVSSGFITIDIFDLLGRRIRRLANRQPVAQSGSIIWDGKDDEGRVAKIGVYIFLVRLLKPDQDLFKEYKKTAVLMKR